jgi:FkbM family methyltransferase
VEVDGDHSLRLDYDLNETSVVVDAGGYRGQWTSDINAKFNCRVFCFEPIRRFSDQIARRFERNRLVSVHPIGLASGDAKATISHREDASSVFAGTPQEEIELRDAVRCFADLEIERIDLIKINIEGGEYDLLERLIESGFVVKIKNIQVQFHDFVPDAIGRAERIRERLRQTHEITYRFDFVWENWRRKSP